jgi:tellurite resistance protein TehA-like permease
VVATQSISVLGTLLVSRLKYDPQYWGMVFPFGMYTVCTFQLANAIGFPPLLVIPRYFIYLALAGWIAASFGLMTTLVRNEQR